MSTVGEDSNAVTIPAESTTVDSMEENAAGPQNTRQQGEVPSSTSSEMVMGSAEDYAAENLEDYETQWLGFTPKSFVSGIYNAVSEYFTEALKALEDFISDNYSTVMTRTEVAEKMNIIRKCLVQKFDKAFDTLETYLAGNVFCIPENVVLPEDRVQLDCPSTSPGDTQDDDLQQDIAQVKKEILAVKLANKVLNTKLQQMKDLQSTLDALVKHLTAAESCVRNQGVGHLRDSLKHCADKILGTMSLLKEFTPSQSAQ